MVKSLKSEAGHSYRSSMLKKTLEIYNNEKPDEYRIPPDSFDDVWTVKGK